MRQKIQLKQNFCAGFKMPNKKQSLPSKVASPQMKNRTIINNGIYFGQFGLNLNDFDHPKIIQKRPQSSLKYEKRQRPQSSNRIITHQKPMKKEDRVLSQLYNSKVSERKYENRNSSPLKYQTTPIQNFIVPLVIDEIEDDTANIKFQQQSNKLQVEPQTSQVMQYPINQVQQINQFSVQNQVSQSNLFNSQIQKPRQQMKIKRCQTGATAKPRQNYDFDQDEFQINQSIDQLSNIANNLLQKQNNQCSFDEKKDQSIMKYKSHRQNKNQNIISRPQTSNIQTSYQALDRFSFGDVIGKGSYAVVRLARDKLTGKQVAIKQYEKNKLTDLQKRGNVKREILILQKLSHPNIIKMLMTISNSSTVNIVMEYVGNKSMREHLKSMPQRKLSEQEAKTKFKQIVEAIDYCHQQNIIHRDIKLENLLIDSQDNIKVIDFGFSIISSSDQKQSIYCGTPSYMAPEIVNKQEYYAKPVDIWSLGVLLYVFLNGRFPFRGKTDQELFSSIRCGVFRISSEITLTAQRLINHMLKVKPNERFTIKQILRDQWLQ